MQHMMMVVPVDTDINEAEDITEKDRQQRPQRFHSAAIRHLHLQHHNRDDDRNYAVAEGLQSALAHLLLPCGISEIPKAAAALLVEKQGREFRLPRGHRRPK